MSNHYDELRNYAIARMKVNFPNVPLAEVKYESEQWIMLTHGVSIRVEFIPSLRDTKTMSVGGYAVHLYVGNNKLFSDVCQAYDLDTTFEATKLYITSLTETLMRLI